ncbi:MAG: Vps5 C terminal like-domain-containing protein [Lentinula lateritia]|nr:MAG: Vps5 C terminal like-domain-containing protein [Lentinula lateritia]
MAMIRPSMIEEPELQRHPTPPTVTSSTSSLSGPSSPTAVWGPLSGQMSGWGEHEPYTQPEFDDGMSASAPTVLYPITGMKTTATMINLLLRVFPCLLFALEKCIQKIANHPVLSKDPDLKLFLESDTFALDIKHRKIDPGSPGPSSGIISSIGQTLTGTRFYETDDYFDSKRTYLDSLEAQLHSLVKSIDLVSKHRMEMAQAVSEFGDHVKELAEGGDFNTGLNVSGSSQAQQLSQTLMGLAEVERKAQDLHVLQSEQDMITVLGTVDEYARLIGSVRNADVDVIRVKQVHERNRGTSAYGGNSPTPGGSLSKGASGALVEALHQVGIRLSANTVNSDAPPKLYTRSWTKGVVSLIGMAPGLLELTILLMLLLPV